MRPEIYNRLNEHAQRLVDQIEGQTGLEIQVLPRSVRSDNKWVGEVIGEDVVGVITGPDSIVIESPGTVNDITDEDYIHELLHLHRIYVANVPHLYPKKKLNGNAAAAIENWLEHVVIYERQIEMCPGFAQKMNAQLSEYWQNCPWNSSGSDLKFNLLSRYLITHRFGSVETKEIMAKAIEKLSPIYSVRTVARQCAKAIGDKHAFVLIVLRFCEIPKDLFWLRRYDVKNHKAVWFPI
jgi:hypothetical protein